jgi:hypothetical protein
MTDEVRDVWRTFVVYPEKKDHKYYFKYQYLNCQPRPRPAKQNLIPKAGQMVDARPVQPGSSLCLPENFQNTQELQIHLNFGLKLVRTPRWLLRDRRALDPYGYHKVVFSLCGCFLLDDTRKYGYGEILESSGFSRTSLFENN